MKEHIDRLIKESLTTYELPFDANAWDQFAKRLDQAPAPSPFYKKWWFAASVVTLVAGFTGYFTMASKENTNETPATTQIAATNNVAGETTGTVSTTKSTPASKNTVIASQVATETHHTVQTQAPGFDIPEAPQAIISYAEGLASMLPGGTNKGTTLPTPSTTESSLKPVKLPAGICQNEQLIIDNPNATEITVILPNRAERTIAGKKSGNLQVSEAGKITVKYGNVTETILVHPSPTLSLYTDGTIEYENGIPTIRFEAASSGERVDWETSIKSKEYDGNRLIVHPFSTKNITVKASVTDQNGCAVTENKAIQNDKEYQLLAVTGFTPQNQSIQKNRLFMPFALTVRDTPFELTIINPKNNNAVIYHTTDPTAGWDGTDMRNGEMVPIGGYVWIVSMKDPLPGEPREYKGIITRE